MKAYHMILCGALLLLSLVSCEARELRFSKDGDFRILQLTDLHLQSQNPQETDKVFARMDSLVRWEQPDLITVTGDLLYSSPAAGLLRSVVAKLDSFGKPWVVVWGNHDHEHDLSRQELAAIIMEGKHTLNTLNPEGELADIDVAIMDGKKQAYHLYFMDSHAYSPNPEYPGYAWFTEAQVNWVRQRPKGPALAFFHIPLCEYIEACLPGCDPHPGKRDNSLCWGNIGESVACSRYNSGMFDAMLEAGNVTGVFCGHDHDNDFIAAYKGIALAYGKFSGTDCEYNDLPRGGRVIVLNRGNRYFETWLREDSGRYIRRCRFDGQKIILPKWKEGYQLYGTITPFD